MKYEREEEAEEDAVVVSSRCDEARTVLKQLMSSLAYFLLFCFEDTSLVDAKCSSFYYPLLEHTESHCTALAGQTLLSGNTCVCVCVFSTEKKTEKHLLCPSVAQPQLM